MSMSVSSPSFVLFVPNGSRSEEGSSAAVLLGASTGVLQICPVSADQINSQMMYAPLSDRKEVVTAVAVSSSGQVMCVGTSTGAIAQYTLRLPEGTTKKINDVSSHNPLTLDLSNLTLTLCFPSDSHRCLSFISLRCISDIQASKLNPKPIINLLIGFSRDAPPAIHPRSSPPVSVC